MAVAAQLRHPAAADRARTTRGIPAADPALRGCWRPSVVPATECLADVVRRMLAVLVRRHRSRPPGRTGGPGGGPRQQPPSPDQASRRRSATTSIPGLEIPTGVPIVYDLDSDLRPTVTGRTLARRPGGGGRGGRSRAPAGRDRLREELDWSLRHRMVSPCRPPELYGSAALAQGRLGRQARCPSPFRRRLWSTVGEFAASATVSRQRLRPGRPTTRPAFKAEKTPPEGRCRGSKGTGAAPPAGGVSPRKATDGDDAAALRARVRGSLRSPMPYVSIRHTWPRGKRASLSAGPGGGLPANPRVGGAFAEFPRCHLTPSATNVDAEGAPAGPPNSRRTPVRHTPLGHKIHPCPKKRSRNDRRRLRRPAYLPQSTWWDGVKGDPQGRPGGTERSEAVDTGTPGATPQAPPAVTPRPDSAPPPTG